MYVQDVVLEKNSLLLIKKYRNNQGKLNKRDVDKYMKKMQKENDEPINSALAEALSKLKL